MQDLLETTGNITTFRGSPNSVADCLLTWLDQLPDAVIPAPLHDDAFDAVQAGGVAEAVSIVKQLASEQKAAVYQVQSNSVRIDTPVTKFLDTRRDSVCVRTSRCCGCATRLHHVGSIRFGQGLADPLQHRNISDH